MTTIKIMALRHSAFYSPLLLAIAGGYLERVGLHAEYAVETPENTVKANLASGKCHVAQSAVAAAFSDLKNTHAAPSPLESPSLVHFAQINQRDGFFLASRHAVDSFSWQDLIGKTVLVDHFFQPYAMFNYALHQQGIDIASLNIIDAGKVPDIERCFREGQGDYVHMQGPYPQQLEHDGVGHVVTCVGDAIGPVAFSSLCARHDWLQTDMAAAFMTAYRQAREDCTLLPAAEIAACLLKGGFFTDINRLVLNETIACYQRSGSWGGNAEISLQAYETLLDIFMFNNMIDQRYPYESVIVPPPN